MALAKAVICDGLSLNSVEKPWPKSARDRIEPKGYSSVGYYPVRAEGGAMTIFRVEAL